MEFVRAGEVEFAVHVDRQPLAGAEAGQKPGLLGGGGNLFRLGYAPKRVATPA